MAAVACERGATTVRMVGHGSSDNAASYGVYAFGLLPGWTALRDSISLYRVLRHTPRHSRRNRDRSLAVGADSGRHRVRLPRAEGGCLHGRADERSRVRPRGGGRGGAAAGRGPGAVGRGDEDVSEPDRRAGAPRRPLRRRRPTLRRGPPRDGPAPGGDDPSLGGADPHCRAPLRLGQPDVRDRPRYRVRNGPRDRAEAARDVPSRG